MKQAVAAFICLICSILLVGGLASFTPLVNALESRNYDFLMQLRGPLAPPDDIVVVAIDNASTEQLAQLGMKWPWPRAIHGELIRALGQAGARLIVFDVVFDLPGDPGQDAALAEAVAGSRVPIVMAASLDIVDDPRFNIVKESLPLDMLLQAGAHYGFAKLTPDGDSVIRRAPLTVGGEPALSVAAYGILKGPLDVNSVPVVDSPGGDPEILINYVGKPRSVPTVSFVQALDYEESLPSGIFRNKVAIVGRSEAIQDLSQRGQDLFPTPFGGVQMSPGAEIHANVLNSLLRASYLYRVPPRWMLVITALLALLVTMILVLIPGIRDKVILAVMVMAGYVAAALVVFIRGDTWMWVVQPLMVSGLTLTFTVFHQYRALEKERKQIRGALEGYVSGPVMNKILADPRNLELGGEQVVATVLFSDIAGFSRIAENTTPRELSSLLNRYFASIGDSIMGCDGMINKYIGDAVMAIWGVPLPNDQHAVLACRAALKMQEVERALPEIHTRIGINTGPMVAGNLGHYRRMEYTVIGDAVNLASRLEGANKTFGTSIMISEFTEELVRGQFVLRLIDRVTVLGKEKPIKVFELIGSSYGNVSKRTLQMLRSFEAILDAYESRQWRLACDLVEAHSREYPEDVVVEKVYLHRCRQFVEQPPPVDWDGVFQMVTK